METPEKWHFPFFNEEMGAIVQAQMSDTLLMGRKSYDTFAATWPKREAAGGEDAALATILGRRAQDRGVEPAAPADLAQLRAASGRAHRSGDRAQERAGQRHRDQRLDLDRSAACSMPDSSTSSSSWSTPSPSADGMRLFEETGTALPLELHQLDEPSPTESCTWSTAPSEQGPDGNYRTGLEEPWPRPPEVLIA